MGDPIENNLLRGQLSSLNGILPRVPVQEDVQFRRFGNPTAVDFAVGLDRELHSHSVPPMAETGAKGISRQQSRTGVNSPVWVNA